MKTFELIGPALDWAVAKCEGYTLGTDGIAFFVEKDGKSAFLGTKFSRCNRFSPSTDWSQGGPIIERERIAVVPLLEGWEAQYENEQREDRNYIVFSGPTPLIAAMRCYVASRLGDEVEIPEELK